MAQETPHPSEILRRKKTRREPKSDPETDERPSTTSGTGVALSIRREQSEDNRGTVRIVVTLDRNGPRTGRGAQEY